MDLGLGDRRAFVVGGAGVDGPRGAVPDLSLDAWQRMLAVNLTGQFLCSRAAVREFLRRGVQADVSCSAGKILCVSSVHEVIPWSGYSAYTSSKAALGMMTKTLAQEAAPHGVRVLAIGPGAIKTAINQSVWSDPAAAADLLTKIPMGHMGSTDDIANMAVVLCSDVAGYVTGTTLMVDGAMTTYPEFARGG